MAARTHTSQPDGPPPAWRGAQAPPHHRFFLSKWCKAYTQVVGGSAGRASSTAIPSIPSQISPSCRKCLLGASSQHQPTVCQQLVSLAAGRNSRGHSRALCSGLSANFPQSPAGCALPTQPILFPRPSASPEP